MSFLPTPTHTPFTLSSFPPVPLTTTFGKPLRCTGVYLPTPRDVYMMDDQSACLPTGFKTDEKSFFSPGIHCPSGYYTACSDSAGVSTITTVTCCPIYRSDISLSCVDPLTLSHRWANLFCTWIAPESGAVITVTSSSGGSVSLDRPTLKHPDGINAFGIRMVHQSTDLITSASTTASTAGEGETQSNTAGANPPPTSGPGTAPVAVESRSGLSTGATIAIAVVIPLLAVLAAVGFFLWWRSRRAQDLGDAPSAPGQRPSEPPGYPPQTDFKYAYAHAPAAPSEPYPQEMAAASDRAEMPAGYYGAELPGSQMSPQELPATTRGDGRESGVFSNNIR